MYVIQSQAPNHWINWGIEPTFLVAIFHLSLHFSLFKTMNKPKRFIYFIGNYVWLNYKLAFALSIPFFLSFKTLFVLGKSINPIFFLAIILFPTFILFIWQIHWLTKSDGFPILPLPDLTSKFILAKFL